MDTLEAFVLASTALTLRDARRASSNRVTAMGDDLEDYVKNAYADTFDPGLPDHERRLRFERTFAWLGNSSNPPDLLLRGGDAVEVKKLAASSRAIQLNSSSPKDRLWADDPRVASGAVTAERWTSRDMVYWLASVNGRRLIDMWVVFGNVFCAQRETYDRISKYIAGAVAELPDLDHGQTNELGRLNRVDPLGITSLRVRGMWLIAHPRQVFTSLPDADDRPRFRLLCHSDQYHSFSKTAREKVEGALPGFSSVEVAVADPNNPARSMPVRYISYDL